MKSGASTPARMANGKGQHQGCGCSTRCAKLSSSLATDLRCVPQVRWKGYKDHVQYHRGTISGPFDNDNAQRKRKHNASKRALRIGLYDKVFVHVPAKHSLSRMPLQSPRQWRQPRTSRPMQTQGCGPGRCCRDGYSSFQRSRGTCSRQHSVYSGELNGASIGLGALALVLVLVLALLLTLAIAVQ